MTRRSKFATNTPLFRLPKTKAELAAGVEYLPPGVGQGPKIGGFKRQVLPRLNSKPILCHLCSSTGFGGLHKMDDEGTQYACNNTKACNNKIEGDKVAKT